MELELSCWRHAYLGRGVRPESVGAYVKMLRRRRKRFDDAEWRLPQLFRLNDEARQRYLALLDDEIRLGECYFALRKQRKKPNFDTWVFTRREDREARYSWDPPKGDVWTRSNGRVQAEIELDTTTTMTRVSLRLRNDSEHLTFYDAGSEEVCHRFLRNEASIQAEIDRLKQDAEDVLQTHLLPRRVARDQELLKDLLLLH